MLSVSASLSFLLTTESLTWILEEEFNEGEVALVILLAGQLVFAITGPAAAVLLMSGRPRLIMINALIHFGLTLLLCLFMIKPFGLQGAVVSVCISMGLMPLFYLVPLYRHERMTPFSIKYFKHLLSAVCGLAGMILTSSIFNNNPILSFVLGLLAYAVLFAICLLLLKPDAEDQIVIDKLKQKFGWR
jgi:O-antigen/teichoic acid export membrane protein